MRSYTFPHKHATPPPPPHIFAAGLEWEVEAVLDKQVVQSGTGKRRKTVTWYKVRWSGYGASYETWEPAPYLKPVEEMVEAYERGLRAK